MNEFVETVLDGAGAMYDDVFDVDWVNEQPHVTDSVSAECAESDAMTDDEDGLDADDALEWRMIYRSSKAGSNGGKAYIHMERTNGRTIFSPASKDPQDSDPDHGGQATVGETWRYAELPMLMRNLNVNQIISFWKEADGTFSQYLEWDVQRDMDSKPRNYLQDIAIDAVPIVLPDFADRPPMKRSVKRTWAS
ncbi:uncharacterized protein N7459_005234 [Penicillium hispanicum]|uniref:uncharacterized protein n=1 Tax=Penicillium hispanicum TaxID=1080232 RepID=UPI002541DF64|nr:uncharacterized protein N7459_005234 [Penicillium hispanicum]KAJ5585434.1 hypothetical protein N7459_005234 [Penicillium hispanicum]